MSKKREPLVIVESNFFNTFDTTEDIMEYMTSYGGKENAYLCAMTMAFTPVRVVCQNTLITGLRSAKVSVNLKHNRSIQTDASFYLDIFNQMARTQENVVSAMDTMTKTRLKAKEVESVLTSAYPTASRPTRLKLSANISADDVPSNVWKRILTDKKEQKEEWEKKKITEMK